MKHLRVAASLVSLSLIVVAQPVFAQFIISGAAGAQTLPTGTGTVNPGGTITTSSGTVGVTISGTSTLNNNGTIQQTGTGRAIDTSGNNFAITATNTGNITSVSSDAFRVNNPNISVNLTNSGTISVSAGGQAIDWAGVTAANTLTNQATGIISAVGEDAVRPGQNGIVINAGSISATPIVDLNDSSGLTGSDGIDLRVQKTVTVTNTGTITGRHGIATDSGNVGPSLLTLNNNAGTIQALNGTGLNVDANTALPSATTVLANVTNAFGATIKGGVMASAITGDGDGIDIDGVLTLNNSGDVLGLGAKGGTNNAEGIAAGGGNITNNATGRIIGSTLLADAPNGDTSKAGNGILIDDSNGGNAVAATTVTNSGLIQGKTGFGIQMIGAFNDTVTNNAGGTIRGTGTTAAVRTGGGGDTVSNSGTIQHDLGGIGNIAIALEAGSDTLNVIGGAAAIIGSIDGGSGTNTMNITPGAGNTFNFAHQISNFSSVNVGAGTFNLASTALVGAGITVANGGILSGTGTAQQGVTVQSGGMISAGNSPGTLNITGDLNLVNGSSFLFELGATPAGSDLVAVSNFLNFTGGGTVIFNISNVGMVLGNYDLITFGNGLSGLTLANLQFGILPPNFAGNFVIDSNSVSLVVTAIPEPSTTAAIFGLAILAGVMVLRSRGRNARA